MSKKLTKHEGQQKLDNFLSPQWNKDNDLTPLQSVSAKKRTPPSPLSAESPERKKKNINIAEMSDTEEYEKDHDQSNIKDQKINTGNLPRETIDCMKAAMKELIGPVENKLNRRMQELVEPIEDKINKLLENRITDKKE